MKKILFLLFVSLSVFGQRNGLIDADTTTRPKAGLSALAFSSGQLKIIRNSGNSYGVITSNNSYVNPSWLASIALAKVTGLDTSIFLRKTVAAATYVAKEAGKWLSSNDYTTAEKNKLAGIATGATVNSTDAQLRDRNTHTGTQAQSTITGLVAALGAKSDTSHTHTTEKITDWTAAWAARFAVQSTSGLNEGSNLYYTNARVASYSDARYGQLASANSWTGSNIMSPTLSGTSGTASILAISPTIAQSSTAGYRGVFVSPFEQSTGSGAKLPIDVGTNSAANGGGTHTSRFSVASNGEINFGTLGRMFSNGNFFLGSSPVDAGFKLEVGGTIKANGIVTGNTFNTPTGSNVIQVSSSANSISYATSANIPTSYGWIIKANGITTLESLNDRFATALPIVTGNYTIDPSAQLNVNSTTRGFLPPRMTQAQRNAISSPATGLTLYCTDCTATDTSTGVMQTWNGSNWKNNW